MAKKAVALFAASCTAILIPANNPSPTPHCPCYTATSYTTDPACTIPFCIPLSPFPPPSNKSSTTTIPTPNPSCPLPCRTTCPHGCSTSTTALTHSSPCIPSITPPAPPTSSMRPCHTSTLTASRYCPEDDMHCAPPDCIVLSTTTIRGCERTERVTVGRECKGRCDGRCGTMWVTVSERGWEG
ncbi:hypothetical protein EJ04DRAFT_522283 [Polyplosphaeria fusca]|uniref:Uncharacterized protein n=1 Tax=Polyplosphaeria fusca TaxID=682080 RepID=A0A9P4V4G0_9PLEO|nr:hypothetical protein EJ04DRAFT_522283 [Polyplosphaeria fusca]